MSLSPSGMGINVPVTHSNGDKCPCHQWHGLAAKGGTKAPKHQQWPQKCRKVTQEVAEQGTAAGKANPAPSLEVTPKPWMGTRAGHCSLGTGGSRARRAPGWGQPALSPQAGQEGLGHSCDTAASPSRAQHTCAQIYVTFSWINSCHKSRPGEGAG